MQPPSPAEFQTYRKVSTWLADNLAAAAIDASIQAVKIARAQRPGDNPLAVFDRFPDGAKLRELENRSRAFRRLSTEISRNNPTTQQRIEAWQDLGILATLVPTHNGIHLTRL